MTSRPDDPRASAGTVLVVDDEVLVRLMIADYLRDCGFKVIEAANADEALAVLGEPQLAVEVIFSDIDMPGSMDGFGLARWARSNRPDIVVVLTGSVSRAVNAAADLCESEGTVPKPYDPQTVHDRIRRLLAARRSQKPPS